MALKDILSVSGKSGLFKFISQGRNGIIVESLIDQKRTHVTASAKISALEDIAIYTDSEEVPLIEVMRKIKEKEEGAAITLPGKAGNEELKAFLAEILPDYDRDRVYVSDMKKIVQWYNTLHQHNMLDLLDAIEEVTEEASESESEIEEGKE